MKINIICDFLHLDQYEKNFDIADKVVYLSADPKFGNVSFDVGALTRSLGCQLDSVSQDFCELAAYVYLADKALPRGDFDHWARKLSFLVPVRNPAKWNSVKPLLRNTIATLLGDSVEFHFVGLKDRSKDGRRLSTKGVVNGKSSDCVCLFSGGLDSFAGAAYLLADGRSPLFLSHYVNALLKNIQSDLISEIQRNRGCTVEHIQYRLTSKRGTDPLLAYKAKESSHRSRSFLFMSFAAVVAACRDFKEIYICENGVLALNVPISDARKGSRCTRHAHPLYLHYFGELIRKLYERDFLVLNPFLFWTKTEEAALLLRQGLAPLVKSTVSCWGFPNQTIHFENTNHCGRCIPCLVRRVSLISSALRSYDDRYAFDAFADKKKTDEAAQRNLTDLVYFCQTVASLSVDKLIYRYPEFLMIEAQEGSFTEDKVVKIIRVYKRFAQEVLAVSGAT